MRRQYHRVLTRSAAMPPATRAPTGMELGDCSARGAVTGSDRGPSIGLSDPEGALDVIAGTVIAIVGELG